LGNTIETGTVDFTIHHEAAETFTLENMLPGEWTEPMRFRVWNRNSTTAIKYRFFSRFDSETVENLYRRMNVRVRHTHAGTANPESWPVIYNGRLRNLHIDSTSTPGVIGSSLGINVGHNFYLEFQLDPTAGNDFQNASAVFDLIAEGTQTTNPGWSE
jgi:hypothetical protein